jgi:IS30 family transposase
MKPRPHIHYTESQEALMWEHGKQGDSLQMIGKRDASAVWT